MIGQLHSAVIDAPDPHALATFYAGLLGMEVSTGFPGDGWVVITGAGYRIAFQQAPGLHRPDWPDPDRPQQLHFDIRVADIDEAEPKALILGAVGCLGAAAISGCMPIRSATPSAWCGTPERPSTSARPRRRRSPRTAHGDPAALPVSGLRSVELPGPSAPSVGAGAALDSRNDSRR
jgi:hypothetical protein